MRHQPLRQGAFVEHLVAEVLVLDSRTTGWRLRFVNAGYRGAGASEFLTGQHAPQHRVAVALHCALAAGAGASRANR